MKKILGLLPLTILLFALAGLVEGAVTCTNEIITNGGVVIGTTTFNITMAGITAGIYNASCPVLYGKSTDTGNSTYIVLVNDSSCTDWSNQTAGATGPELNITWDSTAFVDSVNAAFYVVVSNYTNTSENQGNSEVTCTAITSKNIDNTVPDITSVTALGEIDDTGRFVIYANIANATSYTGYHDNSIVQAATTMTGMFSNVNKSMVISLKAGNRTYNFTATDGTNTTVYSTSYDCITGYMYDPETGGMLDGRETGMTEAETSESQLISVDEAKSKIEEFWQSIIQFFKNLFKIQ